MLHRRALEADLSHGLWQEPPTIAPRWFYDERGSRLFDEITRLPEYYPTRAETAILADCANDLLAAADPQTILELGSGTSTKTRLLLKNWRAGDRHFVPIDVSEEITRDSAAQLTRLFPDMRVTPVIADFHHLPDPLPGVPGRRLLLFLGGTVGNFTERQRVRFLAGIRGRLASGDALVIGYDLVKAPERLKRAYDDAAGVTAEFNLNLLDVIARTVPTTGLERGHFRHEARWNERDRRVEMHLVADRDVALGFPSLGRERRLSAGQSILTEISRKFETGELAVSVTGVGFEHVDTWSDAAGDFALDLYRG